jgi:hypothetical protein
VNTLCVNYSWKNRQSQLQVICTLCYDLFIEIDPYQVVSIYLNWLGNTTSVRSLQTEISARGLPSIRRKITFVTLAFVHFLSCRICGASRRPTEQALFAHLFHAYSVLGQPENVLICCGSYTDKNKQRYSIVDH